MADIWEQYAETDPWEQYAVKEAPANTEPRAFVPAAGVGTRARTQNIIDAEAAGVAQNVPTPEGITPGKRWMAATDSAFNDYLSEQISKAFPGRGKPTGQNLRKGPESGELEYWNPDINEGAGGWAAFNTGIGDKAVAAAGPVASVGAPVAAALLAPEVAGGMLANAGVQAAAGGIAAGVTDLAQKLGGRAAGINNSMSDINDSASTAALTEGLWSGAGGLVPFVARGLRRSFKGPLAFLEDEAKALVDGAGKYQEAVDNLSAAAGRRVDVLAHQTVDVNDPAAQRAQGMLEWAKTQASDKLRRKIDLFFGDQNSAVREAFSGADLAPMPPNQTAGKGYVEGLAAELEKKQKAAKDAYKQAEDMARKQFANLPPNEARAAVSANHAVRQRALALEQADRELKDALYNEFSAYAGIDGGKGVLSHRSIELDGDDPLVTIVKKYGGDSLTGRIEGLAYDESTNKYKVDLKTLYETKIRINEDWGSKTKGGEVAGVKNYDIRHWAPKVSETFKDAIETMEAAGDLPQGTLFQLAKADSFFQSYEKRWSTKFLEDFLVKRPNGEFVISNQDGMNAIFSKGDLSAARQLSDLIKADPVAQGEVANYILALYNKNVAPTGLGSKKAHDLFMSSNGMGDLVEAFLNKDGKTVLKNYEDVIGAVAKAKEDAKLALKLARTELGGRMTKWDATQLTKQISNGSLREGEADLIVNMSKKFGPDMLAEIQRGVADNIRYKLYPEGPTGKPNFAALNDILRTGTRDLMKIMPQDYVRNLVTIREALPVLGRTGDGTANVITSSIYQKGARQLVRPMSQEGALMQGMAIVRKGVTPYSIWNALSDPKEMAKLARISRIRLARTRAGTVSGAAVGAVSSEEDLRE